MNELTALPDMNLEEATAKHQELKAIHGVARSMLLEMRDRKGWKALGYSSFEDYGDKEWGYKTSYLYGITKAAEIQKVIENSAMAEKEIPERQLRHLSQVPDDIKKQIWDEVNEENKVVTAQLIERAVNQYKDELAKKDSLLTAVRAQRDEWKETRDLKINSLTEQLNQIEESKQEVIKLKSDMARIRESQSETINKGVTEKLREIQAEVDHKQRSINLSERRIIELKQQEVELEQRVGKVVRHNKAIAEVHGLLESLYCPIFSIMDNKEWDVPNEIINDWEKIRVTIESLLSTTNLLCSNLHQPPVLRVVSGDLV
jgi:hypothetical protein